jgi:hypothetical protein
MQNKPGGAGLVLHLSSFFVAWLYALKNMQAEKM